MFRSQNLRGIGHCELALLHVFAFSRLDARINGVGAALSQLAAKVGEHDSAFGRLEAKIDDNQIAWSRVERKLDRFIDRMLGPKS